LAHLTVVREASLHAARIGAGRVRLSSLRAVSDYLVVAMGHGTQEELRVLFCDAKGGLICDEVMSLGSIQQVTVYPREIIRRALDLGAASLVMAHNHPSGDPTASPEDVAATRRVASAAALFEIELFDHIIVARGACLSFRAEGLI
jgi:DNA repair protein RadC